MDAKSLGIVKPAIDRFLLSKGVKDYGENAGE